MDFCTKIQFALKELAELYLTMICGDNNADEIYDANIFIPGGEATLNDTTIDMDGKHYELSRLFEGNELLFDFPVIQYKGDESVYFTLTDDIDRFVHLANLYLGKYSNDGWGAYLDFYVQMRNRIKKINSILAVSDNYINHLDLKYNVDDRQVKKYISSYFNLQEELQYLITGNYYDNPNFKKLSKVIFDHIYASLAFLSYIKCNQIVCH
jgi:hypothetical protein